MVVIPGNFIIVTIAIMINGCIRWAHCCEMEKLDTKFLSVSIWMYTLLSHPSFLRSLGFYFSFPVFFEYVLFLSIPNQRVMKSSSDLKNLCGDKKPTCQTVFLLDIDGVKYSLRSSILNIGGLMFCSNN